MVDELKNYARVPDVGLTDPEVQRCFDAAVRNLLDINTVPCDFAVYNDTGLLDPAVPFMFRAGGDYDTPWTRDAAVNTWNAGGLLLPPVARNTLLAVCVRDEKGDPIIQPDTQKWDRIVWAVGAWQYYLTTGDAEFLKIARDIVKRALTTLRAERFSREFGLFKGGSFFNDGIAGYPADVYEPGVDSSFVGDHPRSEEIMCLSTNVLYCQAYRILGEMEARLGFGGEGALAEHYALKDSIYRHFRQEDGDGFFYLVYPDGRKDPSRELAGHALAALFDISPGGVLENLHSEKFGIPSIWPPFVGLFSREKPGRHNNLIWPFLNGFYIQAAAKAGMLERVSQELGNMTRLVSGTGGCFYEIYNPYDGTVDGGWQIGGDDLRGHKWDSCVDQTWSATGYIGAILHGVFGIRIHERSVEIMPCVPEYLRDSAVRNLVIRGMGLDIQLHGWGRNVGRARINGEDVKMIRLPFDGGQRRWEVEIWME